MRGGSASEEDPVSMKRGRFVALFCSVALAAGSARARPCSPRRRRSPRPSSSSPAGGSPNPSTSTPSATCSAKTSRSTGASSRRSGRPAGHRFGAAVSDAEEDYLKAQTAAFAKGGYRFPDLLAQIAASDGGFAVILPKPPAPPAPAKTVASLTTSAKP
jgi:hypothetical protein